ncbi:hypothetical protein [Gordonia sp. NPDC003585]|uniref:hypothetical protein n=1 Tax=Gordonia sp. NPDC003585 TaxID=3154275 RepID=UPI0033B37A05
MGEATRGLTPGQRFDLAMAMREALLGRQMSYFEDKHLVDLFGIELVETQDEQGYDYVEWTATFTNAHVDRLTELADYLGVELPLDARPEVTPTATAVDAYTELVAAETALRDVIRLAVPAWQSQLDEDAVAKLELKRAEEDKKRDGITVSQDLLDYTEICQLQKLIDTNWQDVKPILDDKKRTEVYLDIIFDIRNTIGHSRPVVPSERLLLAGAAGQIRNQLARYRSGQDGSAMHYSSIDSARDSLGTNGKGNVDVSSVDGSDAPRLDVGDVVTFQLEATDPRGREVSWSAFLAPSHSSARLAMSGPTRLTASGRSATVVKGHVELPTGGHQDCP